ncbi:MAG TPA: aminoglycoside phosphotransferase family protein [Acidimicrobiales bacterium]|nr:aminoglycoside phosphotransferase family protein [Acidimicrobiales bacterium]
MDTPPPAALDPGTMTTALRSAWSIDPDQLAYVPKGVGSYHWRADCGGAGSYFVTVDDLDTKPWIGRDPEMTFTGLAAAYETAWSLYESGLELVVAPIPSRDGRLALRLDQQYSIAVFPFVDGRAGTWGDPIAPDERDRLLRELAVLHRATSTVPAPIARRRRELPERDELLDALANLDRPWRGGAYSERARLALSEHASRVLERLARFDDLASHLDHAATETVVTHGEPHPGNLINTVRGLRLIDWDTVALAEPERDLWMLDRGPNALDAYIESSGRVIDQAAIDFYRLMWTLSDIASFTDMFRREHERTKWAEQKWSGFVTLLEGASSTPYARR